MELINKMLMRSFWLKKPQAGFSRIIIFVFILFILLIESFWLNVFLAKLIFSTAIIVTMGIVLNSIFKNGYYHRLESFNNNKIKTEVVDYLNPSNKRLESRVWKIKNTNLIYSGILLDPNTHKTLKYFDFVRTVMKSTFDKQNIFTCLNLGSGACSVPLYISSKYPNSIHVAVDSNPVASIVAKKYFFPVFGKGKQKNIKMYCKDAYVYTNESTNKFDFILQDIYARNRIPAKFLNKKWIHTLKNRLKSNGIILINLAPFQLNTYFQQLHPFIGECNKVFHTQIYLHGLNLFLILSKNGSKVPGALVSQPKN